MWISVPGEARAANLTFVSNTLSTSNLAANANHTIKFTVTNAIPASGKIIITPQAEAFTIPAQLDYTDIDITDDSTDLILAASPGSGTGSAIGVSITSGTSGSITFTLNDTDGLALGSVAAIEVGTNATFGVTGDQQIQNSSSLGFYRINIKTYDNSDVLVDQADAMIAIVETVSVSAVFSQCSDGIDNDGDGKIDFPSDPGCESSNDDDETDPSAPPPPPPPSGGGGGGITPPKPTTPIVSACRGADFNLDSIVNSIDFSILLFFWKTAPPFANVCVDINKDAQINSVDFSILLFQWGGSGIPLN